MIISEWDRGGGWQKLVLNGSRLGIILLNLRKPLDVVPHPLDAFQLGQLLGEKLNREVGILGEIEIAESQMPKKCIFVANSLVDGLELGQDVLLDIGLVGLPVLVEEQGQASLDQGIVDHAQDFPDPSLLLEILAEHVGPVGPLDDVLSDRRTLVEHIIPINDMRQVGERRPLLGLILFEPLIPLCRLVRLVLPVCLGIRQQQSAYLAQTSDVPVSQSHLVVLHIFLLLFLIAIRKINNSSSLLRFCQSDHI